VNDPGVDLAVVGAMYSSYKNKKLETRNLPRRQAGKKQEKGSLLFPECCERLCKRFLPEHEEDLCIIS